MAQYGGETHPGRVSPECLGDYSPFVRCPGGGLCATRYYGENQDPSDGWRTVYLLPGVLSDEEIYSLLGVHEYYGGVGRPFARTPHVERNATSTMVTHCGGWDV